MLACSFSMLLRQMYTVLVLRMAHRKWKEIKQQPSMLSCPAGCRLVSFHILWANLSTSTVQCILIIWPTSIRPSRLYGHFSGGQKYGHVQ